MNGGFTARVSSTVHAIDTATSIDAGTVSVVTCLSTESDRHIPVESCFNLRDLGGYATAGGRQIRWRRLFRADGLHRTTEEHLDDLGLVTVLDLRTNDEVHDRGRFPGTAVDYHHLPMFDVLPTEAELEQWAVPRVMADHYLQMLDDGADSIREVFAVLSDPSAYPAVFHCAAGKDRTGVVAAVLLGVLGVPGDVIVADYALSGKAMLEMLGVAPGRVSRRRARTRSPGAGHDQRRTRNHGHVPRRRPSALRIVQALRHQARRQHRGPAHPRRPPRISPRPSAGSMQTMRTDLTRRAVAEFVGTAFLVAVVVGSGIAAQRLSPDDLGLQLFENAAATAAGLVAIILAVGPVSGAHLNPVVSIADAVFGGLSWRDVAAYVPAQIAGGVAGSVIANLMYDLPAVEWSTKVRNGNGLLLAESVATLGLLLVIFGVVRSGRSSAAPFAVGAYIGAAYWFTASTSFANPAVTIGRVFTDTFAGIKPSSAPLFITFQLVGGAVAVALIRYLYPKVEPVHL